MTETHLWYKIEQPRAWTKHWLESQWVGFECWCIFSLTSHCNTLLKDGRYVTYMWHLLFFMSLWRWIRSEEVSGQSIWQKKGRFTKFRCAVSFFYLRNVKFVNKSLRRQGCHDKDKINCVTQRRETINHPALPRMGHLSYISRLSHCWSSTIRLITPRRSLIAFPLTAA